jgi:hypothetical protein
LNPIHYIYNFKDLAIQLADIEPLLTGGNSPLHDPYPEYINEILSPGDSLFSIEGGIVVYENIKLNRAGNNIEVNDTLFSTGKIVTAQLRNSEMLAFFLCTAGAGIENLSRNYFSEGDFPRGFVADLVGTVVVEAAMDRIHTSLKQQMNDRGWSITNRYSPGYCGWNVAEQQKLFSLLPEKFCNISLSPHSLMSPIKSVSGIIGIGKKVKFNDYNCHRCELHDCIFRNRKHKNREGSVG